MKKILVLILGVFSLFSLVGCGGNDFQGKFRIEEDSAVMVITITRNTVNVNCSIPIINSTLIDKTMKIKSRTKDSITCDTGDVIYIIDNDTIKSDNAILKRVE